MNGRQGGYEAMESRSIWNYLEREVTVWKYPEATTQSSNIQNYRAVHCLPDTSWLVVGDI